jgi:hypothetical protein
VLIARGRSLERIAYQCTDAAGRFEEHGSERICRFVGCERVARRGVARKVLLHARTPQGGAGSGAGVSWGTAPRLRNGVPSQGNTLFLQADCKDAVRTPVFPCRASE